MDQLTNRQQQMLAFERQWWKYADARDAAVRDLFGCSAARYRAELAALIDQPAALACDPLLVKRLQRRRDASGRARHPAGRRLG
jgi:Protein of unknown function (DUF3263)